VNMIALQTSASGHPPSPLAGEGVPSLRGTEEGFVVSICNADIVYPLSPPPSGVDPLPQGERVSASRRFGSDRGERALIPGIER